MLASRFNFFKKSAVIKELGPICYYQFQYNNIDIILIGETHDDLPPEVATQYIDLFNKLLTENKQIKIFVEKSQKAISSVSDEDNGFIDALCRLSSENKEKVIPCDSRDREHGWDYFMSFLRHLAEVVSDLDAICKTKHKNIDDVPFFQNEDFVNSLYESAKLIVKQITIPELCEFFNSQLLEIDRLADQYAKTNHYMTNFLGACVLGINDGLDLTLKLQEEYVALGFTDEFAQRRSLGEICIDMMVKRGNFSPGGDWLNALSCYVTNYLDAKIACQLWDEMQLAGNEKQTIIVATGAAHTNRLALIMAEICESVRSLPADSKNTTIMPERMSEYLQGDFEHAATPSRCAIM